MIQNTKTTVVDGVIEKTMNAGAKGLYKLSNCNLCKINRIVLSAVLALCAFTALGVCAAATDAGAEATINTITNLLKTWIPRLGGLIVVVGGIQLGIGFKDDNADGKTRGMQCMIGGAIVAAIGAAVSI